MSEVTKKARDIVQDVFSRSVNGDHKLREERPVAHKALRASTVGLNLLGLVNGGLAGLLRAMAVNTVINYGVAYANGAGYKDDYSVDFRGETITGKQRDVREFIFAVEKLEKISDKMQKSLGDGFAAEVAQGYRKAQIQSYMAIVESKADKIFVEPKRKPSSNGQITF